MLEVRFRRDSRNRLSSVVSRGHADAADHGEDVVCAAVSALLQAAWAGLTDVAGVKVHGRRLPGDFSMTWPEAARDRADVDAIVRTAELAVEQIAKQREYRRYVRYLREVEPDPEPSRAKAKRAGQNRGTPASKGTAR
ncbi:MAG TPA: ribosomal-processing cysteine protease Prp [Candidatus Elarobacter sp.]|nr:ribosomal-processing cysteine protease Prp [Candidatus Elarobacter sp.]